VRPLRLEFDTLPGRVFHRPLTSTPSIPNCMRRLRALSDDFSKDPQSNPAQFIVPECATSSRIACSDVPIGKTPVKLIGHIAHLVDVFFTSLGTSGSLLNVLFMVFRGSQVAERLSAPQRQRACKSFQNASSANDRPCPPPPESLKEETGSFAGASQSCAVNSAGLFCIDELNSSWSVGAYRFQRRCSLQRQR
jgi:hypothetical protein